MSMGILAAVVGGASGYSDRLEKQEATRQEQLKEQARHERAISLENLRASNAKSQRTQERQWQQEDYAKSRSDRLADEEAGRTRAKADEEANYQKGLERLPETAKARAGAEFQAAQVIIKEKMTKWDELNPNATPEERRAQEKMLNGWKVATQHMSVKDAVAARAVAIKQFDDTIGADPDKIKEAQAKLKALGKPHSVEDVREDYIQSFVGIRNPNIYTGDSDQGSDVMLQTIKSVEDELKNQSKEEQSQTLLRLQKERPEIFKAMFKGKKTNYEDNLPYVRGESTADKFLDKAGSAFKGVLDSSELFL